MNKARRIGPLLIMLVGALMIFAPSGPASTLDVGGLNPCQEEPPVEDFGAVSRAVPPKCCEEIRTGIVIPCEFATTTEPPTTTTTAPPTTTEPPTRPTTTMGTTTTMPVTTTTARVGSGNTQRPRVLARTGSDTLPMTVAGVSLLVLGAGLAVAGRRRSAEA